MPDVKRKNNLSITNVPDDWEPPTDPLQDNDWEPPTKALFTPPVEEDKPNLFERAWAKGNEPLVNFSPEARAMADRMAEPGLNDSVPYAMAKGMLAGSTGAVGDMLTGMSSPIQLGLGALSGGASMVENSFPKLANAMHQPARIFSAGMVGHGGYNTLTQPTAGGKAGGLAEMAMGLGGLRGPQQREIITDPRRLLGPDSTIYGKQGLPDRKLLGPGRTFNMGDGTEMPPMKVQMPPEFTAVGDEPAYVAPRFKNMQQFQYDLARKRQGMGLDLPSLPHKIKPSFSEPQFATSGKSGVKIGADVRSLGKVLGSSLYKGDIGTIATKELLQNAIDAVRHLGKEGKVEVDFMRGEKGTENSYVQVKDNGRGMTLKELQSVFTDLGSSGKRDDVSAVGGFGLAKAAPLLGGERVEVTSIVKEGNKLLKHTFSGTPDELLDGVQIKTEEIKSGTTGTTVRTYVPKDTGSFWQATSLVNNVAQHSSGNNAKISVAEHYYTTEGAERKVHESPDLTDAHTVTLESPAATVEIIVPKGTKYSPRKGVRYQILNNGMWQTTGQHGYEETPGIPEKVLVNVKSKVPEGDTDYPFTANRENLRGSAEAVVEKYLEENIVRPAQGKRIDQLKKVYEGMPKVELKGQKGSRPFFVYDVNNKFTPEELKYVTEHPDVVQLATHISDSIHEVMEATGNKDWNKRLEKVGLIFDEGLRGIHIPNPGSGHSAILINPFQIMEGRSPEQSAAGILHVILHEIAHVEGGGHDEGFTTRLADIYEQYGARKALDAQDIFLGALQDGNNFDKYKPEIADVLQKYSDARGRKSSTEDPLRGTGISAKNTKSGRKGKVPSNPESSPAVNRLVNAMREAGPLREEQEDLYSQERGRRFAKAEGFVRKDAEGNIANPGLKGYYKQLGALKGRLPKVDFERTKMQPGDVDSLIDMVTDNNHLLPGEKIRAKMALLKLLTAKREELPQRGELRLLGEVFGKNFADTVEMHGGLGGPIAWENAKDLIQMPKAVMASIDMSAPLRQGLPLIHKKEWWKSIGPMVKMFGSQEVFDAAQKAIKDDPAYLLSRESGLKLTDVGHDPMQREEAYGSKFANLIPGVKASERAYVGFLNKLRFDTFKGLLDDAQTAGLHKKDVMHEIAHFVNTATGRGTLPGNLDKVAHDLNTVFFSPRLIASRVAMMNPATYVKASPFVRREFLKSAAATASAGLIISGLMSAMGAKTDTKLSDSKGTPLIPIPGLHGMPGMPVNADFGKSRFGNTRIEGYGGFLTYVTYFGRMMAGERQSSTTNKMFVLGKGFNAPTRATITEDFVANKLSPVAGLAWKILKQKDPQGKDYQFSPTLKQSLIDASNGDLNSAIKHAKSGEMGSLFVPMFIGDMIDIYKDDPKHFPLGIGSWFGTSLQTYGKTPRKSTAMRIRP